MLEWFAEAAAFASNLVAAFSQNPALFYWISRLAALPETRWRGL